MSYAAAVEPLRAANQITGQTLYRWQHVTPGDKPAVASNGASVLPEIACGSSLPRFDLMFVCAGGTAPTFRDNKVFTWLRRLGRGGVILGGISGGPFVLARAGVLAGRRSTLHWEHIPAFREEFPDVRLTRSLFEIDGDRITCSGGIAALDMMVTLITRDHGPELGRAVGEWFLHTQVRDGERPQRMELRFRLGIEDERLLSVLRAMETHMEVSISRERLAGLAGLSLRQLERGFRRYLGQGVHEYYLSLRLQRSVCLLRETSLSILEIALATGFTSGSQFSRAFRNAYGYSPRQAVRFNVA